MMPMLSVKGTRAVSDKLTELGHDNIFTQIYGTGGQMVLDPEDPVRFIKDYVKICRKKPAEVLMDLEPTQPGSRVPITKGRSASKYVADLIKKAFGIDPVTSFKEVLRQRYLSTGAGQDAWDAEQL